jgi:hypothetical protein
MIHTIRNLHCHVAKMVENLDSQSLSQAAKHFLTKTLQLGSSTNRRRNKPGGVKIQHLNIHCQENITVLSNSRKPLQDVFQLTAKI